MACPFRPTLFAFYFAQDDELMASINCTSPTLEPGASTDVLCRGVGEAQVGGADLLQVLQVARAADEHQAQRTARFLSRSVLRHDGNGVDLHQEIRVG